MKSLKIMMNTMMMNMMTRKNMKTNMMTMKKTNIKTKNMMIMMKMMNQTKLIEDDNEEIEWNKTKEQTNKITKNEELEARKHGT